MISGSCNKHLFTLSTDNGRLQCESKKSPHPRRFSDIFWQMVENFRSFFTCLYVPIYARVQIFIQFSQTL